MPHLDIKIGALTFSYRRLGKNEPWIGVVVVADDGTERGALKVTTDEWIALEAAERAGNGLPLGEFEQYIASLKEALRDAEHRIEAYLEALRGVGVTEAQLAEALRSLASKGIR